MDELNVIELEVTQPCNQTQILKLYSNGRRIASLWGTAKVHSITREPLVYHIHVKGGGRFVSDYYYVNRISKTPTYPFDKSKCVAIAKQAIANLERLAVIDRQEGTL